MVSDRLRPRRRLIGAIIVLTLAPSVSLGQSMLFVQPAPYACTDHKSLTKQLASLGETRIGVGTTAEGHLIEHWVRSDPAKPSFTILMTTGDGISCIVATGLSWLPRPVLHNDGVPM